MESMRESQKVKLKLVCEISGSHGGEYEEGCLLGCCAVYSGRSFRHFRDFRAMSPDDGGSKHL
jgi:hypothetical protein